MKKLLLLVSLLFVSTTFAKTSVNLSPEYLEKCTKSTNGEQFNWIYSLSASENAQELEVKFFTDFAKCNKGKREMQEMSGDLVVDIFGTGFRLFNKNLPVVDKDNIRGLATFVKMTFDKDKIFKKKNKRTYRMNLSEEWSGKRYPWVLVLKYDEKLDETTVTLKK